MGGREEEKRNEGKEGLRGIGREREEGMGDRSEEERRKR